MDCEQKYKEALERAKIIYTDKYKPEVAAFCKQTLESIFPELAESKDDKIRNEIKLILANADFSMFALDYTFADMINWLEKQGESNKPLYIRFGDIPSDEKSKIYCNEDEIGIEEGVSVYPAFETNGNIVIGLSLPITQTTLHTQQHLLEYENRPCYLVTGDYVCKGSDGEPLIKNVRIIKEIKTLQNKEE